jgi:hypothetical protein
MAGPLHGCSLDNPAPALRPRSLVSGFQSVLGMKWLRLDQYLSEHHCPDLRLSGLDSSHPSTVQVTSLGFHTSITNSWCGPVPLTPVGRNVISQPHTYFGSAALRAWFLWRDLTTAAFGLPVGMQHQLEGGFRGQNFSWSARSGTIRPVGDLSRLHHLQTVGVRPAGFGGRSPTA